jgi:hypothetical protein
MAFIPNANRNRAADAVCIRANNGLLVIYSGTVPASADAALSGNTVLAQLTMSASAFAAAGTTVQGRADAGAITADSSADNTGTATFFRVLETGGNAALGTPCVFQGTVGVGSGELQLSSTSIIQGGAVSVTSLTYTQSAS